MNLGDTKIDDVIVVPINEYGPWMTVDPGLGRLPATVVGKCEGMTLFGWKKDEELPFKGYEVLNAINKRVKKLFTYSDDLEYFDKFWISNNRDQIIEIVKNKPKYGFFCAGRCGEWYEYAQINQGDKFICWGCRH